MPSQKVQQVGLKPHIYEPHAPHLINDYEGRLYNKSDSLHKKQIGVEKAIIQLKEKIALSKPEEAKSLKTELKQLKTLRYELFVVQQKEGRSLVGRICSVWRYFVTSSKRFTVEAQEAGNFLAQVGKVFDHEIRNVGKGNVISFERAGKEISYADLFVLTERRIARGKRLMLDHPDLADTPGGKALAQDIAQAEALSAYLSEIQPHVKQHVSTKQFVANLFTGSDKGTKVGSSASVGKAFGNDARRIIEDSGKYLAISDSRVTIWENSNQELSQKMKILVKMTFPGEIKVGLTRRSMLGKTNIEFVVGGKQLSKAELVERTVTKIQEIQNEINAIKHDEAHAEEIQKLNRRLLTAEELVKLLLDEKVVEYLSKKKEVLYGVLKGISMLSAAINYIVTKPMEVYDNWTLNRKIQQLVAPYALFREEGEVQKLELIVRDMHKLLSVQGDAFESGVEEFFATMPSRNKALFSKMLAHKNKFLDEALRLGNVRAAHYLIAKGLFKSASDKVLAQVCNLPKASSEAREQLIRDLFVQASDHKSIVRIIDYLYNTGEAALAEKLLLEVLEKEKANRPHAMTEKHIACLQMATRIGSDRLLEAAFGITTTSTNREIIESVKPYVLVADPYGETLLGYACGGHRAQFVIAVNLAIKEKYLTVKPVDDQIRMLEEEIADCRRNSIPDSYIEALEGKVRLLSDPKNQKNYRQLKMDALESLQKFMKAKKSHKEIQFRLVAIAKEFPELSYLIKRFDKNPKELKDHIRRERENLQLDPFLVRNIQLARPVQLLSPSLATDMDKELEQAAKPRVDGSRPRVECFGKAVQYYNVLRSRSTLLSDFLGLTTQLYSWAAYLHNILPTFVGSLPSELKYAMKTKNALVDFYAAAFGGVIATWSAQRIGESSSLDTLKGFDRNLDQFRSAYPLDKPYAEGPVDIAQAPSHNGVIDSVSTALSAMNPVSISSHCEKSIARRMVHQDTEGVISLLDELKGKKGKVDGGRLIEAYRKLLRYPGDSRIEIFGRLFGLLSSAKELDTAVDLQLNSGVQGRECVRRCIDAYVDVWRKEGPPKMYQYEAAIFAAVKLGDLELLERLLDIKAAAAEFAAAGRWKRAGGEDTSLLHAAIASKIPNSSKNKAAMVRRIYEEMVKARRVELEADALKAKKEIDPFMQSRKGVMLFDLVSFADASALDKEFDLNPQLPGSFTYTIEARVRKRDAGIVSSESLISCGPSMIIAKFALPLSNIAAFSAAMGAAKFGPVAMLAADITVRILFLKVFSVLGATTGWLFGEGFTRTLHQIENELYADSSVISQLGRTQKEREEILRKYKKGGLELQAIDKEADEIVRSHLLEGIDNAVQAAKDTGDFLSQKDLNVIKAELNNLPEDAPNSEVVETLHSALLRADVAPPLRLIIIKPLLDTLTPKQSS